MSAEPIDLVYTWVDDSFAGYREQLLQYAQSGHDSNPNRTRDNLQMLRYSMRSVAHYLPWVRHIYLLSCRPQVPPWLDVGHPRIRVVHHDQVMDPAILPTYNSFAIVSHLHLLPGLSRRFVYLEDDVLIGRPLQPDFFADAQGRLQVRPWPAYTRPSAVRGSAGLSMWDQAMAHSNHALDQAYGENRRYKVEHAAGFIDRDAWAEMIAQWPEQFAHTRASRFRAVGNVAPEYLYPYFELQQGRASLWPARLTPRALYYHGLKNCRAWNALALSALHRRQPATIALNDDFGQRPRGHVVVAVRRFLEARFPWRADFERSDVDA